MTVTRAPTDRTGSAAGERAGVVVRVLGVLDVLADGRDVPLGGPRQRAVLARVLAAGPRAVSAEEIVYDVWGERGVGSTVASVHAYVSRLRRLLGEDAIPRRRGGYVLDRRVVAVDAEAFVEEVDRGRRALARGRETDAATALETALGRWRGPRAYGNLGDAPFLAAEVARLEELRLIAAEALADAHTRQGRGGEDVALLEELAARDPLREPLAIRLVTALYAAGRQADALAAFERCRRSLREQLGVDPGGPLRRVHAAVLAQQPPVSVTTTGPAPPWNLPPRNRSFVGRRAHLSAVGRALDDDVHRPRAVALTGLAGAGKTELALELAYRRRREGRVAWWIAAEDPTGTAHSLDDLAVAMGITHHKREEETRAALWVELDRTPGWILVFDNVDEPGWIEPFLPTALHGDVIITSRNPAWRRLARPIAVPPLARPESVMYVTERSGDPDAEAADALADLLGDLPLALEQACAYIEQTGMSVPDYVRLFRERRASLLLRDAAGGPTVTTTWGLAFDRLWRRSPRAAAVLETMAFLSPDAIELGTLAPLADDELDLQDALAELLRLSLVDRKGNVLRVHRLVQDVVRARLSPEQRRTLLEQAADLCVADAPRGAAHLVLLAAHSEAIGVVPDGLVGSLAAVARRFAGRALYPAAEQVLAAALRLARVQGGDADPVLEGALTCQLGEVLDAAGRLGRALELHRRAVEILDRVPVPSDVVRAHAHNRLGHVLNCADDVGGAIAAHERALATLQDAGRADLAAAVLVDLGYTLWSAGRLARADETLRAGRALLERQGHRDGRDWAHATAGLGLVEQDRGHLDEAVAHQRTAIEAFTRVCGAAHPDTAQAWDKLGYALRLQGRAQEAVEAHTRGLRLLERVLGVDDSRVAMTLTNLGLALLDTARPAEAVTAQARAHAIFRSALGPTHASTMLAARRWAVALAVAGHPGRARVLLEEVLDVATARASDNDAERGRIAADAAAVYTAVGDLDLAKLWRKRAMAALSAPPDAEHPQP
ncbi:BTAD domain-containing putative transcriptional regulator [Pseudonocardia nigra]|uniref:BTAD domain-containing putative transcriptional regulator n=1 Tax=Pseudonocardia nigra TaxID=1921578 RepID=UPI001C5DFBF8|nr:BTAD domain-containing putative transcriptional regulator [Pseudonocardia nigra]